MDISQAIRNTENALRDFIAETFQASLGEDWILKCGVTQQRILIWTQKKEEDNRRLLTGATEERLLYYADLFDLKTILKKNWSGDFSQAFGKWRQFEVLLDFLEDFRNPNAHHRELLPHQKNLALGIDGEIRNRVIRFRSRRENMEDFFPKFESLHDSLGNLWIPSNPTGNVVFTENLLHSGDSVDFIITARDPEDLPVEFRFFLTGGRRSLPRKWMQENEFHIQIVEDDISLEFTVGIQLRSQRQYHASQDVDATVLFFYKVLPRKNK